MRKWKICCAFAITSLVLVAPSSDAGRGNSCYAGRVMPNGLIVVFNVDKDEALRELFETDLDWIEQEQPIHDLFLEDWWPNIHSVFVQFGPETRRFRPVPREAAERRLGKLKAALEDLPYVDRVFLNGIFCIAH